MSAESKSRFDAEAKKEGFAVDFSSKVARVVRYQDALGVLEFTTDSGSKGDHSIAIDPPSTYAASARVELAVGRAKRFLEACGFEVELPSKKRSEPVARANVGAHL
jgi:hypothetical protein